MIIVKAYRKLWNEDQIKYLLLANDNVLYSYLRNLYNCQTEEEKETGNTSVHNGIGFNAYDAPFLSAMIKSLNQWGHLTNGQKEKTRKILPKYSKQLVNLANDKKYNKEINLEICNG